jgi:hypothetical protein
LSSYSLGVSTDDEFLRDKTRQLRRAKYSHFFFSKRRKYKGIYATDGLAGVMSAIRRKVLKVFGWK